MEQKSIKKNYLFNLSYQIITLIAPLLTTPYLARVLGPGGIGLSSYTNSIVTYFVLAAVLGTADYGQREIAYLQDDKEKRSIAFWNIFLLRAITSLFSLCMFIALTWNSANRILYLLQAVNIICIIFDITWFFQGMEDFALVATRNIVVRVLYVAFIFLFIKSPSDLPYYIGSIGVSALLGHLTLWLILPRNLTGVSLADIRPFADMKTVLQLFLPQIAIQVSAVLDKTMLGRITGSSLENGYYEQADRIEKICLTVVSALGVVMIPRISYLFAKKQDDLLNHYIYRAYRFIWMAALPMTCGLIAVAGVFIPWFLGPGYEKSILLTQMLSVLLCIVGLSSVTGVQYLVPAGLQNKMTVSVVIGLVVNIILNALLIGRYLSVGAAAATLASEAAVTVSQLYMVRNRFSSARIFGLAKNYAVSAAIMLAAIMILKRFTPVGIIGLGILVMTGAVIYVGVLWLLKDSLFMDMLDIVIRKLDSEPVRKFQNRLRGYDRFFEIIFLVSYACYFFYEFLGTSMFDRDFFVPPYRIATLAAMALVAVRFLEFDRKEWKKYGLMALIIGITGLYMVIRHHKLIFIMGVYMVAVKNCSFKKVSIISLVIGLAILAAAYYASSVGIIPYLVYKGRGIPAHAMGMSYSTDCAAHWFFLLAAWFVVRNNRIRDWEYPFYVLLTYIVFRVTRARTNMVCMLLLLFISIMIRLADYNSSSLINAGRQVIVKLIPAAFIVCPLVVIIVTYGFNPKIDLLNIIDNKYLGHRLSMSHTAFVEYGLSLFGKEIPQMGFGRSMVEPENYFCLDISYIQVLLERGVLVFLLICGMMTYIAHKAYKRKNYIVLSVVAVIALHCMVEHHLLDLSYNFFLLLALAQWDMDEVSETNGREK